MWLPVAMLVAGLAAGLIAGGRWRAVRTTRVRMWPLGALGLAFTVLPWIGDPSRTTALIGIGWALLIAFALFNLHVTGMSIVAIGLACNLAALLANQAMPVRAESAIRAGIADESTVSTADLGPARRLAQPDDRLEPLTAIIPLSALGMVVTFGDLIALFGLMDVGFRLARRPAPRHSSARKPARAHAAKRGSTALPAWVTQRESTEGIDDWVLDLRETMRTEEKAPMLASLAPDDEEPAPELEVRYSGQPLPSRH
jgi:hypothetical protein